MKSIFKVQSFDFELQIIDYDEPNNGRALWIANIVIKKEIHNQFFKHRWNRLNFSLDSYQICDEKEKYIFVPAEAHAFLLPTQAPYTPIYLPYKALSTLSFIGNFFQHDYLIVLYTDGILLFNLRKQQYVFFSE